MAVEDARRGGCLDGIVSFVTRGNYGIETVVVFKSGREIPHTSLHEYAGRARVTIETILDDEDTSIQRRLIKTPKVI